MRIRKRDYAAALKSSLMDRAGGRCEYCGGQLASHEACIDHVDPDGADDVGNYRIACRSCNSSKGRKSLEEFRLFMTMHSHVGPLLPDLGFSTKQLAWLNEQGWFPHRCDGLVVFDFERGGEG